MARPTWEQSLARWSIAAARWCQSRTVTFVDTGTNAKTSVETDAQGGYIATPLRIGNYSASVEVRGFKTETRTGIVLQVQDRLRVDFTLQVGLVSESVNVHEAAPVVQIRSPPRSAT